MMNQISLQQNAISCCDERRGLVSISDSKGLVVCPKPRRVGILANNPIRPLRWPVRYVVFGDFCFFLIRLFSCFATQDDFNVWKLFLMTAIKPKWVIGKLGRSFWTLFS
jgi:hypothetical protein